MSDEETFNPYGGIMMNLDESKKKKTPATPIGNNRVSQIIVGPGNKLTVISIPGENWLLAAATAEEYGLKDAEPVGETVAEINGVTISVVEESAQESEVKELLESLNFSENHHQWTLRFPAKGEE